MKTTAASLTVLVASLFATFGPSQVPPDRCGYLVSGTAGQAGSICFAFDCTPRRIVARAGETLTLTTRAPLGNFYAIGIATSATSCRPIPRVANMLILDPPVFTLALGVITMPDGILACWGGVQNDSLPLPATLPPGFTFATQAIGVVPGIAAPSNPAFSVAVVTSVIP